jgi:transposase
MIRSGRSTLCDGRALVKHAGLAPRQKNSGNSTGRTRTTGQGRPALRLAAWRAVSARRAGLPRLRRIVPVSDGREPMILIGRQVIR